ncbi:hypothetical protein BRARA_A03463 [Brassica rapa]|uniref:Peptidase A1 domain-containing protein n=1 Tax=Brassica campestris TaxID=3711 RepID=A0A398AVM7_BRACM|nr:hypothetical protein BRARA_A03463 [Brassica rapa]
MTVGQPPLSVNLVLDVSGSALFFQCGKPGYKSTSYDPILCGSRCCPTPKDECFHNTCYGPFRPTCRNETCTSADVSLLPDGANGVLGLANSSTSFVSDLVSSYKIPYKVALCLPSKSGKDYSGNAYIGGGPYLLPLDHRCFLLHYFSLKRKDLTGLLVSTPLISNRETKEHGEDYNYFIDVKSIEVNGKRLSFDHDLLKNKRGHWGRTKIKNVIPYTLLEAYIYKALVRAFSEKTKKRKAVYPFTDCFSYKSFGEKSLLGKETPVISLVLGEGAKWDIYGPNSLVKVNKNVVCLAFQEADEFESLFPIEIGGYQMEDNLVEFDLEASKFSFTSSLLRHNTSCSPQ